MKLFHILLLVTTTCSSCRSVYSSFVNKNENENILYENSNQYFDDEHDEHYEDGAEEEGEELYESVPMEESAYLNPPSTKYSNFVQKLLKEDAAFRYFLTHHDNDITTHDEDGDTDDDDETDDGDTDDDEKYKECTPYHIHLSLGNENPIDDTTSKASMTISFSISSSKSVCHPESTEIVIEYDIQETIKHVDDEKEAAVPIPVPKAEKAPQKIQYNNTSLFSKKYNHNVILNQYQSTSPKTNETYTSDWIYHVLLDNLDTDALYWYSIQVFNRSELVLVNDDDGNDGNINDMNAHTNKNRHQNQYDTTTTTTTTSHDLHHDAKSSIISVNRHVTEQQEKQFSSPLSNDYHGREDSENGEDSEDSIGHLRTITKKKKL
mmetsp:Transcript_20203/g.24893  ORF Transcript_20203/g.24893 Transcript_20203/m.24893 type:complete len:378 (+) Transcript_20203:26-1159(+)